MNKELYYFLKRIIECEKEASAHITKAFAELQSARCALISIQEWRHIAEEAIKAHEEST